MINKIIEFLKKTSIRSILPIIGIVLVIISSTLLLWHGNANSNQSIPATSASIYFEGVYQIGEEAPKQIVKGLVGAGVIMGRWFCLFKGKKKPATPVTGGTTTNLWTKFKSIFKK